MDVEDGEENKDFILPHKSVTASGNEHVNKVKSEDNDSEIFVENEIYICTEPSCLAKFSDAVKLKVHRNKHYPKNCRCTICDIGHPDHQSFQNHQSTYHNLQPDGSVLEPHKCHKCDKISKDSKALKRHIIETHRPNKFPCHLCSFQFTRPENLRVHLQNYHKNPLERELFKCTYCDDRSFKEKSTLRMHIREHHRDTGQHHCCDNIYNSIIAYKRHQKNMHGSRSHLSKCTVCGVITDGRHESRHARTKFHQNALKRNKKVNKMDSKGQNGKKIKKEEEIEDVKPEIERDSEVSSNDSEPDVKKMCTTCQKPFKYMESHKKSEYHLRKCKIAKEKMDKNQNQEICPVVDPQKVRVTIDNDYDYSCKICKMEFTTSGMLKSHLRCSSHLKIYNFLNNPVKEESVQVIKLGCSICDLTFKYKHELAKHLTRKYHLKKMKSLTSSSKQESIDDDHLVITKIQSLQQSLPPGHIVKNCHVLIENLDLNVVEKCIAQNDFGHIIENFKFNQKSLKPAVKNCHEKIEDLLGKNSNDINNTTVEEFANTNDGIIIKEEDINYDIVVEDDGDTSPSFNCMYCNSPYKSLSQVQDHESKCVKLRASRKTYNCPTCFKVFPSKGGLERHSVVHTSPSAPKYKCNFCDQQFRSQQYRTLHENRVHLKSEHTKKGDNKPKPRYDCCGKSYSTIKSYKAHIDGVHLKIRHPCSQCNHISKGRKSLLQHIQNIHGKELFQCKICNRDFHSEKCMADHLTRKRHLAMVKGVKYYKRNI